MTLDEIRALLVAEGMVSTKEEVDGVEQIVLALPSADDSRLYGFEIMYIPDHEQQVASARLLQIFATLVQDVARERFAEVRALVAQLNAHALLPGFNLHEELRLAYFRHVALMPVTGTSFGPIAVELVWLSHYFVDRFGPAVESVAHGLSSAADAWERLRIPTDG